MSWRPDPSTPLLNGVMFLFVEIKCSINHVREQCLKHGYTLDEIDDTIEAALSYLDFIPPIDYPVE